MQIAMPVQRIERLGGLPGDPHGDRGGQRPALQSRRERLAGEPRHHKEIRRLMDMRGEHGHDMRMDHRPPDLRLPPQQGHRVGPILPLRTKQFEGVRRWRTRGAGGGPSPENSR